MELHVFAPYVIALSDTLVHSLGAKAGDNICFAVTKDKKGVVTGLWIGVETIFSPQNLLSYELKKNHYRGMYGFSAKQLVYDLNLSYGIYTVDREVVFSRKNHIDWRRVIITSYQSRNWKSVYSCDKKKRISRKKNINFDDEFVS